MRLVIIDVWFLTLLRSNCVLSKLVKLTDLSSKRANRLSYKKLIVYGKNGDNFF